MSSPPGLAELLRRYSGDLFERIEFVETSDANTPVIHKGLLFLMAFWSVPAVRGFKNVCSVFRQAGLPDDFILRVLDIDGASRPLLDQLSEHPIRIGGNGEGYWFHDGKIFAATNFSTTTDLLIHLLSTDSAGS